MGRHEDKANMEGVYNTKGKEYVRIDVAAKRVERSTDTINLKIKNGLLTVYKFEGLEGRWIRWDKCKAIFDQLALTHKPNGAKKKKVDTPTNNDFVLIDLNKGELAPVGQKEMPSLVDVDDPVNSDCWKLNSKNQPVVDKNGHHVILYDKFKQKYDALIRKQQFEREKGQLVSKDLVDTAFSKMLTPLVNTINQIPDRYASRIIGFVESIMETKLDNSQTTSLRALLEDEAVSIIGQLKKNEEDAIDGLLV